MFWTAFPVREPPPCHLFRLVPWPLGLLLAGKCLVWGGAPPVGEAAASVQCWGSLAGPSANHVDALARAGQSLCTAPARRGGCPHPTFAAASSSQVPGSVGPGQSSQSAGPLALGTTQQHPCSAALHALPPTAFEDSLAVASPFVILICPQATAACVNPAREAGGAQPQGTWPAWLVRSPQEGLA